MEKSMYTQFDSDPSKVTSSLPNKTRRIEIFNESPRWGIVASKLLKDTKRPQNQSRNEIKHGNPDMFSDNIRTRARKNLDAKTIKELLPDTKLIRLLLTSLILSPIDIDSSDLTYSNEDSGLPNTLLQPMRDVIMSHFTKKYRLQDKLHKWIPAALIDQGAKPVAIIPESLIDDLINNPKASHESYRPPMETLLSYIKTNGSSMGYIGHPSDKPSLESSKQQTEYTLMGSISISDNTDILNLNDLLEQNRKLFTRQRRARQLSKSTVQLEGFGDITEKLYKTQARVNSGSKVVEVHGQNETSRRSIGDPFIQEFNSESIQPICSLNDPETKHGYIAIYNPDTGQPLDVTGEISNKLDKGEISFSDSDKDGFTSNVLDELATQSLGYSGGAKNLNQKQRKDLFIDIFEKRLMNSFKNGIIGSNVQFNLTNEFLELAYTRFLKNESTRMVFIPAEQLMYLTYEVDEDGIGVSLLDELKEVATQRCMVNYASMIGSIKNAIGRSETVINIDPRDPNPEKTFQVAMDAVIRQNSNLQNSDINDKSTMYRQLQAMSMSFKAEGNDKMSSTSIELNESGTQRPPIDSEYVDRLERLFYMGLYVTKEMVDATQSGDFAITQWTNNQLFSKRISMLQNITARHLKHFIKNYTLSSGNLIHQLQTILKENHHLIPEEYLNLKNEIYLFESLIAEFIDTLEVSLPKPEKTKYTQQLEAVQTFISLVDAVLPSFVATEEMKFFADENEDESAIDVMLDLIKNHLIRVFCQENNIMPEISNLLVKPTDDNPSLDLAKDMLISMSNLLENIGEAGAAMKVIKERRKELLFTKNKVLAEKLGYGTPDEGGNTTPTEPDAPTEEPSDTPDDDMSDAPPTGDEDTNTEDDVPPDEGDAGDEDDLSDFADDNPPL